MTNNNLVSDLAMNKAVKKTAVKPRRTKHIGTTREIILDAAEVVFSKSGYAGATVERIAKQAKCYESLIYYHCGNKDKLFSLVLQNAYRKLIDAEQALTLDLEEPEQALRQIILFLWEYYQEHPELIILLNTENLLKGKHLAGMRSVSEFLSPAVSVIEKVLESGAKKKVFKDNVNVMDLYLAIMGLGYFYLSNRYTLTAFLDKDLMADDERTRWGGVMVDMIFATVRR